MEVLLKEVTSNQREEGEAPAFQGHQWTISQTLKEGFYTLTAQTVARGTKKDIDTNVGHRGEGRTMQKTKKKHTFFQSWSSRRALDG